MTPQEKALELCQQFGYLGLQWEQTNYTTLSLENAKQCALTAVDEILSAICFNMYEEDSYNKEVNYWQQVKQDIEKL